ncbi:hypothetical protein AVEN_90410-1 [Araneus ventricosus]|uniref:Uncharacterized protein n=1 Tax=Araneus ventricosus TaxID=182803 RepID=A0A4Y2GHS2_ARAVE|nr:hypothetical protein AVEN_90410-1 [Araneus ventricosus]
MGGRLPLGMIMRAADPMYGGYSGELGFEPSNPKVETLPLGYRGLSNKIVGVNHRRDSKFVIGSQRGVNPLRVWRSLSYLERKDSLELWMV